GRRFTASGGEGRTVAVAWSGAGTPDHWSTASRPVDFFDLKGLADGLCEVIGIRASYCPSRRPALVPGRTADIGAPPDAEQIGGNSLGYLGQLLPVVVAARGLAASDEVYVAEFDLDLLAKHARSRADIHVEALPRYPSVVRDLSLVVDATLPAAEVRGTIR